MSKFFNVRNVVSAVAGAAIGVGFFRIMRMFISPSNINPMEGH